LVTPIKTGINMRSKIITTGKKKKKIIIIIIIIQVHHISDES
jgi:hypothetical protein